MLTYCLYGFVFFTSSSAGVNLSTNDSQYISYFTPMWTPTIAAKLIEMLVKLAIISCLWQIKSAN